MTTTAVQLTAYQSNRARLIRAWLLTAVIDGLFASVLSAVFYQSTVARLWQRVAGTLIGSGALDGGAGTVLLGLVMHLCVAFAWSAVFLLLVRQSLWLRDVVSSRYGVLKVAAFYGPAIWMVMSLAVIPVFTQQWPAITFRWWVQFFAHIPFVALPMVFAIGRGAWDVDSYTPTLTVTR